MRRVEEQVEEVGRERSCGGGGASTYPCVRASLLASVHPCDRASMRPSIHTFVHD